MKFIGNILFSLGLVYLMYCFIIYKTESVHVMKVNTCSFVSEYIAGPGAGLPGEKIWLTRVSGYVQGYGELVVSGKPIKNDHCKNLSEQKIYLSFLNTRKARFYELPKNWFGELSISIMAIIISIVFFGFGRNLERKKL